MAGELETRWNKSLEQVAELETRLGVLKERACPLTEAERRGLLEMGSDLKKLWRHEDTPADLKKRLLRTVLLEVVVQVHDDPPRNELRLHWQEGCHTTLSVPRNPRGRHGNATDKDVVELIRELAKVYDDREIARTLNLLGYRTGKGNTWQAARIVDVRNHYRLPQHDASQNWDSMLQASAELGVSTTLIQRLIDERKLPESQVVKCAPWIIGRSSLTLPVVQLTRRSIMTKPSAAERRGAVRDHHAALRDALHDDDQQPPAGGLGQADRRRPQRHRDSRPLPASCRDHRHHRQELSTAKPENAC